MVFKKENNYPGISFLANLSLGSIIGVLSFIEYGAYIKMTKKVVFIKSKKIEKINK